MDDTLWHELTETLKEELREVHFSTWDRQVVPLELNQTGLKVAVANKFIRDWIQDHFLKQATEILQNIASTDATIELVVDPAACANRPLDQGGGSAPLEPVPMNTAPQAVRSAEAYSLNPRYKFDTFVVGPSNQFAHAASLAVASAPAQNYNPLFLYGGTGLGKTHLLNAIGQAMLAKNPQTRIAYISSEQFVNKLVHSIRFDRMNEFRRTFRDNCDLLLIDDIQFIAGKERTQEEFFHTFDKLYNSGKQIVLSSDCSPNDIHGLEERLRSRFQWGLIADIQVPDLETRIAIVKKKADAAHIHMPDNVAYLLASSIKSNIRELEGSLIRLSAFASLLGQPISVELAQEVLQSIIGKESSRLTIDRVQKTVAEYYQIRLSELLGRRRTRSLALPRQIAMYLCRTHIQVSYPEIGNKFGGKDHSTVVHAVAKITKCLSQDESMEQQIRQLEERLNIQ